MKQVRRAEDRGYFDHGWLKTAHTFSFGHYFDPAWNGFHTLRVINEDVVAPGQGFGMHGHKDMEIVTIVLQGELEHKDSLGNGEVLRPGELQRMTAGSGIRHSEFNPSSSQPTHLYQIWLFPEEKDLTPGYEQKPFPREEQLNQWRLVASRDGRDGSLTIQQRANLWLTDLSAGQSLRKDLSTSHKGWLQILKGQFLIDGHEVQAGDALYWSEEDRLDVVTKADGQLLLFELE